MIGNEPTIFWLVVQYHVPQIIKIVPHVNVREIFNGYCLEAIHKNTKQAHASTCNGFAGDLCHLKHAEM